MEDPESAAIRTSVFEWLRYQAEISEDVFHRKDLINEVKYRGEPVPLVGPQGIFKPKVIRYYPISITTSPESPYMDELGRNQLIQYKYRGNDPGFHENVRLKRAMQERIPLVYFIGLVPNKYLALFPVFIIAADDKTLTFTVEIGDDFGGRAQDKVWRDLDSKRIHGPVFDEVRREYVTRETLVRVHQREFRERVLHAYNEHCSFCSLKHRELHHKQILLPGARRYHPDKEFIRERYEQFSKNG
jgi:putative restriction endonuclease